MCSNQRGSNFLTGDCFLINSPTILLEIVRQFLQQLLRQFFYHFFKNSPVVLFIPSSKKFILKFIEKNVCIDSWLIEKFPREFLREVLWKFAMNFSAIFYRNSSGIFLKHSSDNFFQGNKKKCWILLKNLYETSCVCVFFFF